MARALTPRQAAFCRHMLEPGITATEAARRAGYSHAYANRQAKQLLDIPQIAAKLAALRADSEHEAGISRADVLRGLHAEAQLYGEGASHSARVAAWAHLGKHLGMFTDKSEVTIKRDPRSMSTDELEGYLRDRGLLE